MSSTYYNAADADVSVKGDVSFRKRRSKTQAIVLTTLVILLIGGITGLIVYFAAYHNQVQSHTPGPGHVPGTQTAKVGMRVDCLVNDLAKSKDACALRTNCIWDNDATDDGDKCYLNTKPDVGVMLTEVETPTDAMQRFKLSWSGEKWSLYSEVGDIIENITVEIQELNDNMLRVTFLDSDDATRYKVPLKLNLPTYKQSGTKAYKVLLSNVGEKFFLKIMRSADNTIIFDTSVADIVMEKQYLSLSTRTPTGNVYGLGENLHRHFKHQFKKAETWAMFARDQPPGQDPKQHFDNLYGVHPFYVCIEDSGNAHGVFLLNSNAQDMTLTPGHMITYRTIGGILDYFIFTGPTPENVVQQYTSMVGRPYMPPYWALGFQLCRYGYSNTSHLQQAVERTRDAAIPHDVQYADIDYMDARKDFTIDSVNFGGLAAYFADLRANHSLKTIIILDPALSIQDGYDIYPEGKEADIYIKWPSDNSSAICDQCTDDQNNMFGYVWPDNKTVFPDFFKSSTKDIWKQWIVNQSKEIEFDGLWIDMNEPANFDTNKDKPWNWDTQRPNEPAWNLKCDMSHPLEKPPYKTKACHIYAGELRNISDKTLCMVGVQGENNEYTHYDVHNLYGWSQTEPTLDALRAAVPNKRGMVISRSTFAGSGAFAGHWLGDNSANWQHLRDSIIGMLEFNLFGIPYVGADICGFFGDSNAQLCKRWMQLGAFYPFSRNHNGIGFVDHDPASFSDTSVAELSKTSLETRYRLLPYLYTLFYHANIDGSTVVRPLQFEWPTDKEVLDISEQFLWGSSILFSPILYEDQTSVEVYLPESRWYDYYEGIQVSASGKHKLIIPVNGMSEIPIHIRGGSIIPMKESALTTTQSRKTPFKLLVASDENSRASGDLYWDDGDSIDATNSNCWIEYTLEDQMLNGTIKSGDCQSGADGAQSLKLPHVTILGVDREPAANSMKLNGAELSFTYNSTTKVLDIENITQVISQSMSIQWQSS